MPDLTGRDLDAAMQPTEMQIAAQLRALKRQHRELREYAVRLADTVDAFIVGLDAAMKRPESRSRGEAIGRAVGSLEMALHQLQHFGLGLSFEAMRKKRKSAKGRTE